MGHYKCLDCGDLTGIPIDGNKCRKCHSLNLEHCTCGSGGHPQRCDLHPNQYYLHCFDIDVGNIIDSTDEEIIDSYESTFDKKPYNIVLAKTDLIVEVAKWHLITRRDNGD